MLIQTFNVFHLILTELKQEFYTIGDRRSLVSAASLAAKASYFQQTRGNFQRRRLKSGAPYLGIRRQSYSSGDELEDDDGDVIPDRFEYWDGKKDARVVFFFPECILLTNLSIASLHVM